MAVTDFRQFFAWQLADQFNTEVHRLVVSNREANRDLRYRGQILDSARGPSKHIAEGFLRNAPLEFARFLDYAVSSLVEAEDHLKDGVRAQYFAESECTLARRLGRRCFKASIRLKQSQIRYAEEMKRRQRDQRQRERPSRSRSRT